MATDEQLIEQIQKGESEAYGELFRRYYQQINFICLSVLKNTHDAEEVTQETFIHAYLKLDQLKKPDKFFAWLKKIAQNRSKNYVRRTGPEMIPFNLASSQTAREEAWVGGYPVQSGVIPLTQITPDEHLLKQELRDSIMEAVEALPPKDREVVQAHIDGLNHAEISERFGISVQASTSRLYRARKKLAAQVKDLLNAIFGLPKMLPVKKIISGGILAMKIGTSAKVTIGVIGVLVAGFIGFQIVMRQPDVKSPGVETQQPVTAKVERSGATVAKKKLLSNESSHQRSDVGGVVTPDGQDTEQLDERKIEEALAWFDELAESATDEKEATQESEEPEEESQQLESKDPRHDEYIMLMDEYKTLLQYTGDLLRLGMETWSRDESNGYDTAMERVHQIHGRFMELFPEAVVIDLVDDGRPELAVGSGVNHKKIREILGIR